MFFSNQSGNNWIQLVPCYCNIYWPRDLEITLMHPRRSVQMARHGSAWESPVTLSCHSSREFWNLSAMFWIVSGLEMEEVEAPSTCRPVTGGQWPAQARWRRPAWRWKVSLGSSMCHYPSNHRRMWMDTSWPLLSVCSHATQMICVGHGIRALLHFAPHAQRISWMVRRLGVYSEVCFLSA